MESAEETERTIVTEEKIRNPLTGKYINACGRLAQQLRVKGVLPPDPEADRSFHESNKARRTTVYGNRNTTSGGHRNTYVINKLDHTASTSNSNSMTNLRRGSNRTSYKVNFQPSQMSTPTLPHRHSNYHHQDSQDRHHNQQDHQHQDYQDQTSKSKSKSNSGRLKVYTNGQLVWDPSVGNWIGWSRVECPQWPELNQYQQLPYPPINKLRTRLYAIYLALNSLYQKWQAGFLEQYPNYRIKLYSTSRPALQYLADQRQQSVYDQDLIQPILALNQKLNVTFKLGESG